MRRISIIFLAAFLLGILLTASYFYLLLNSGEPVAEEPVFQISERLVSKAASNARHDPANYQPLHIDLTRDMNPIALSCGFERKKRSGTSEYGVEVWSPDETLHSSFPLRLRNRDSSSVGGTVNGVNSIGSFSIKDDGTYRIQITPQEKQGLPVLRMNVRVRRNATPPSPGWLIGGAVMGVVGLFGGIGSMIVGSMSQKQAVPGD